MTAEEFKAIRQTLGLSLEETAQIFRVEPDYVRRWESTAQRSRNIPRGVVLAWRLMERHGIPADLLAQD